VRDKLLGKDNHDIDIALDNVTGKQFAETVNEYLRSTGHRTSSVAVIQANPEQSKHLETATTRVFDMWIDFVNLRAEVYDPGSRIPRMTFGTAVQDAERRDFTVNALFYNVTTNEIEDMTGSGVDDLAAGLLRTPLDPHVTFLDDPLRVMRAVRFASRFGFHMVAPLRAAAQNPEVLAALRHKVSRERVGNETDLMLAGPRPLSSARVLHAFGLVDILTLTSADDAAAAAAQSADAAPGGAAAAAGAPDGAAASRRRSGSPPKGGKGGADASAGGAGSRAAAPGFDAAVPRYVGHLLLPPLPLGSAAPSAEERARLLASSLHLSAETASEAAAAGEGSHVWMGAVPESWRDVSFRLVGGLHAALRLSPALLQLLRTVPDPSAAAAIAAAAAGAGAAAAGGPVSASPTHADHSPAALDEPEPLTAAAAGGSSAMDVDGTSTAAWPYVSHDHLNSPPRASAAALVDVAAGAAAGDAAAVDGAAKAGALGPETQSDALQGSGIAGDVKRALLYATLIMPLATVHITRRSGKLESLAFEVLGVRLKRKHDHAEEAVAIQEGARLLMPQVSSPAPDRLQVGLALRNACKAWWPAALVLSAAMHITPLLDAAPADDRVPAIAPHFAGAAQAIVDAHVAFAARIRDEWALDGCWAAKPLLDGKAIMTSLGVKGPAMKPVIDELVAFQLLHPHETPDSALTHLRVWQAGGPSAAAGAAGGAGGSA
jgi:hypothetical protein